MAKRKGDANFPCENLVELLIGASPMSVLDVCGTDFPERCGYRCRDATARRVTIRTALELMANEGVLVRSRVSSQDWWDDDKETPPVYSINPLLHGVLKAQEMRSIMAEAQCAGDRTWQAATAGDSAAAMEKWSTMFKTMSKRRQVA